MIEQGAICKHLLRRETCASCNPPPSLKSRKRTIGDEPVQRARRPQIHSRKKILLKKGIQRQSLPRYAVVCTWGSRENQLFRNLGIDVWAIHIEGSPSVWALKLIRAQAPNLRRIQVVPNQEQRLRKRLKQLGWDSEIEVSVGYGCISLKDSI